MSPFEPWTTRDKVERVSMCDEHLPGQVPTEMDKSELILFAGLGYFHDLVYYPSI